MFSVSIYCRYRDDLSYYHRIILRQLFDEIWNDTFIFNQGPPGTAHCEEPGLSAEQGALGWPEAYGRDAGAQRKR